MSSLSSVSGTSSTPRICSPRPAPRTRPLTVHRHAQRRRPDQRPEHHARSSRGCWPFSSSRSPPCRTQVHVTAAGDGVQGAPGPAAQPSSPSVTQLAQPVNGPFDGRTATSSNTAVADGGSLQQCRRRRLLADRQLPGPGQRDRLAGLRQRHQPDQHGHGRRRQRQQARPPSPSTAPTTRFRDWPPPSTTPTRASPPRSSTPAAPASPTACCSAPPRPARPTRSPSTTTGPCRRPTRGPSSRSSPERHRRRRPRTRQQGTAAVTSGGTYTGTANDTYTFTVRAPPAAAT